MRGAGAYSVLLTLAEQRFGSLSESERKVLEAASTGEEAICGRPTTNPDVPENDPARAQGWGHDRTIRAALFQWLCIERKAREHIHPFGKYVEAMLQIGQSPNSRLVLMPMVTSGLVGAIAGIAERRWPAGVSRRASRRPSIRIRVPGRSSKGHAIGPTTASRPPCLLDAGCHGKGAKADRIAHRGSAFLPTPPLAFPELNR